MTAARMFATLCCLQLMFVSLALTADRPQIVSSGGHIYIKAADGKNIEFRPSKTGRIRIGEHNLLQLVEQFSSVSSGLQSIQQSLDANLSRVVDRLQALQSSSRSHRTEFRRLGLTRLPGRVTSLSSQLSLTRQDVWQVRRRLDGATQTLNSVLNQVNQVRQTVATNPCDSSPCRNGGSCVTHFSVTSDRQLTAGYRCLCNEAWTGANCTIDKDECQYFRRYAARYGKKHPRDCVHGSCVNQFGTYDCACQAGYYGARCDQVQDTCAGDDYAMCGGGGVCVSKGRGHVCICHDGFDNEVAGQRSSKCVRRPCLRNTCWRSGEFQARCIERPEPPYYTCQCPRGFHGNGEDCTDIDECADYQSKACPAGRYCINTVGGFECLCSYGHGLNANGSCVFLGGCAWNPCGPYQKCTPQGRFSYKCDCLEGFTAATGGGCQLTNQTEAFTNCTSSGACNNGTCMPDDAKGYRCSCNTGYTGPDCLQLVPCPEQNFCQNGGTCSFNQYGMRCTCPPVYSGRRCEQRNNPCGGVRSDSSGMIRFDPSVYSDLHDSSCQWEIRAPPEYSVTLVFPKFKLRQSPNCQEEFLQIDNAEKYCSVRSNFVLESPRSNVSLYLKKFSMQDNTTELVVQYYLKSPPQLTSCIAGKLGNLVANSGSVRIPSGDAGWPSNSTATCSLRIFLPEFESRSETIFSVSGQLDERVACGSDSNSDLLSIAFYTNNSEGARKALYKSSGSCDAKKLVKIDVTGTYFEAVLTAQLMARSRTSFLVNWRPVFDCSSFERESNSAPHGVLHFSPSTRHCSQTIAYPLQLPLVLKVLRNGESGESICLSVHAAGVSSQEHRNYGCHQPGDVIGPFYPALLGSGHIRVASWRPLAGNFEVEWSPVNCSYTINALSTEWTFHSAPEWTVTDSDAMELLHCSYLLRAADGYQVEVSLQQVSLQGSCEDTYMQLGTTVKNDTQAETFQHYKLCALVEAFNMTSSMSGKLAIVLHGKPGFVSGFNGFRYRVRECGGSVLLPTRGSFSRLRYPDSQITNSAGYSPGAVCDWQVLSMDPLSEIYMSVAAFRLAQPEGGNCLADSFTVRSEGDNDTEIYCGDHGPPPKIYRTRRLDLRFRAALSGPLAGREGFELRIVAIQPGAVSLEAEPQERRLGLDTLRSNRFIRIFASRRTQFIVLNVTAVASANARRLCVLTLYSGPKAQCIRPVNSVYSTSSSVAFIMVNDRRQLAYIRQLNIGYRSEEAQACNARLDMWTSGMATAFIMPSLAGQYVPVEVQLCRTQLSIPSGNRLNISSNIDCPVLTDSGRTLPVVRVSERIGRDQVPVAWLPCSQQPGQTASTLFSGDSFYIDYVKPAGVVAPLVKLRVTARIDCNVTLTGTSGRIQSPPGGPCRWELRPRLAFAMQIDIQPTNLTNSLQRQEQNCTGSAKITDTFGRLLYQEQDCRALTNISDGISTLAGSVIIEWNYTAVQYYSGLAYRFSLTYDGHPCSRLMRQSSGSIRYPSDADSDDSLQSCEWQIEVEPGYQIQWMAKIRFGSTHAEQAYLAVWEGTRPPGPDSGATEAEWKFTGTADKSGRTSGSFLYVLFYADASHLAGITVSFSFTYWSQHSSVCGGHFQSSIGRFASHRDFGHSRYPKNADCAWMLASDPHHYLNLTFVNFSTPLDGSDYMTTYSSWNNDAAFSVAFPSNRNVSVGQADMSGQIKGSPRLPVEYINERQSRLKTVFITDDNQNGEDPTRAGFLAIFQQHCGGELTAGNELQAIESPKNQERICSWTIVANESLEDSSVLLYFSQVHCRFIDLVVNYTYGSGVYERRICNRDYSSDSESQDLAFTLNRARVYYRVYPHSFMFTAASGFVLHYGMSRSSCDFDFSNTFSGYIQSYPNIESISPAEPFFCEWRLKAGDGWIIKLEIITLTIDATSDCHDNYLEMRSKNGTSSEITRLLCSPTLSNSDSQRMFWAEEIRLKQRRGPITTPRNFQFKLKFTREPFVNTRAYRGVLTSPLYPNSYMSSQEFVWRLRAPSWMILKFEVEDFQIEPRCFDYIEIIESGRNQRYCIRSSGVSDIPESGAFYSATSEVLFKFHTDISIDHYAGFRIRWSAVSKSQKDCNQVLRASQVLQTFTYPLPPASNYENSISNCRFLIRLDTRLLPTGHSVFVNFTKVDLEDYYDQLRITVDSANIRSQSVTGNLGYFETKPSAVETDAVIVLSFSSDYSITKTGFTFTFGVGCRGFFASTVNIARRQLILRAPTLPNSNYKPGYECKWTIENFENDVLAVRFNSFDLAAPTSGGGNCESADRLNLTDSITGSRTLYCSSNQPVIRQSINMTARQLTVQFIAVSSSPGARGFNMEVRRLLAGCDREIALTPGRPVVSITDGLFRQHRLCSLTVYGPDLGAEIVVRPVNVAFPPSSVCNLNNVYSGSYLKITEDFNSGSPPQVLCRNNVHDVISRGSPVTLTTYTDEQVQNFNISVSLATCGGPILSDRMSSPNFPENYGNNMNCLWRSEFSTPMNIKLQFNYRIPCNSDLIKLTDCSTLPQNFSKDTFCSSNSGHDLLSETLNIESIQCLQVQFTSGYSPRGAVRKFEIIVEMSRSGCYRVASQSPNQIIFDLNSGPGLTSASCLFDLRALEGYAVRAKIVEGTQCDQGCQSSCRLEALQRPDDTRQWRYLPDELRRISTRMRFPITVGKEISGWTSKLLVRVRCRNRVSGYRLRLRVDFPYQPAGCTEQRQVPSNAFEPLQISSLKTLSVNGSLQRMCAWKLVGSGDQKTTVLRVRVAGVGRGRSRRCRTYVAVAAVHTSQSDSSKYITTLLSKRCPLEAINEVLLTNAGEVYVYFMGLNSDGGRARQADLRADVFMQDCGGFIRSPRYNLDFTSLPAQNTANGTQCAWTFGHAQVEHPSIIHNLTVVSSNLSSSSSCRELVTVDFMQSQLHGSQTSTSYSRVFDSCRDASHLTGRTFLQRAAMIKLSYQSYLSTSGHLSASYESYMSNSGACLKSVSGRRGNFSSDNFPRAYEARNCTWIIHSEAGTAVILTFYNENFGVGMTGQCERSDRLEVWDPNGREGAEKLLTYCHTSQAPSGTVRSIGNQLMVRLVSATSHPGTGFKAKFRAVCSRILRRSHETILHDGRYQLGRTCTYLIEGDRRDTAIMTFNSLSLIDGDIMITSKTTYWPGRALSYKTRDGIVSRAAYLRINSRNQARFKDAVIFSTGGIKLRYRRPRTRRLQRSGQFRFRYYIERCNENVTLHEGDRHHYKDLFKSTRYSFFCRSHITIPPNDRLFVTLRILLPPNYQRACSRYGGKRIITLSEPQNRSLSYYELLNSNSIEHNICVDSAQHLYSWWYTDVQEYSVYQLSTREDLIYSSVSVDMSLFILPGPNRGCGANIQATDSWQTVQWNPQVLSDLKRHVLCLYRISAGPNKLVELRTNESLNWWVYVRGVDSSPFSKSASRDTNGVYGRTVEVLLRHYGQQVLPLQYRAVSDTYQQLSVNATETVQRYTVSGISPEFRLRLRISGPAQRRLLVTFENVSLVECRSQYFTAHDIPSNNSAENSLLNNEDFFFCSAADFSHKQYESVGNSLEVYFHNSNATSTGGRFTIAYVIESCQRSVSSPSGLILSPSGAMLMQHGNNHDCQVTIRPPNYRYLHVHFFMFNVESHYRCSYDSVQFFNSTANGNRGAAVTQKLCGTSLPRPIVLSAPASGIIMRFLTDSSVVHLGYRLTYFTSNSSACGGSVQGQLRGGLQSPATPSAGTRCVWDVSLPATSRFWTYPVLHVTTNNIVCQVAAPVLQIQVRNSSRTICSTNTEFKGAVLSQVERFRVIFNSTGNNEYFLLTWRFN